MMNDKTLEMTKDMEDNYAKLAELAGESAQEAFVLFMRKLADIKPGQNITAFDGTSIPFDQVKDFLAVVADASATFAFGPKITSAQGVKFKPAIVKIDAAKFGFDEALVSGEFSCGGTIRW